MLIGNLWQAIGSILYSPYHQNGNMSPKTQTFDSIKDILKHDINFLYPLPFVVYKHDIKLHFFKFNSIFVFDNK